MACTAFSISVVGVNFPVRAPTVRVGRVCNPASALKEMWVCFRVALTSGSHFPTSLLVSWYCTLRRARSSTTRPTGADNSARLVCSFSMRFFSSLCWVESRRVPSTSCSDKLSSSAQRNEDEKQ